MWCPINATIEAFGDRWSLIVLRDIAFLDRRYFRELQAGSEQGDRLSRAHRVRAELLEQGGPALCQELMDELRHSHLGSDTSPRSPTVRERLNAVSPTAASPS